MSTSTKTINSGIAVHANSIGLLPVQLRWFARLIAEACAKSDDALGQQGADHQKNRERIARLDHASVAIVLAGVETG